MTPANRPGGSSLARFFFFRRRMLLPARLLLRLPALCAALQSHRLKGERSAAVAGSSVGPRRTVM